ncbi:MAG: hypothetical protein V4688_01440 [Pseudomonadota bacterium]
MKQWRVPVLLGLISLMGLLAGLLADGYADGLSWLTLGAVSVVGLRILQNAIRT